MPIYRVELRGESREVYSVEAATAEDATESWWQGDLCISECYGMEVQTVQEED